MPRLCAHSASFVSSDRRHGCHAGGLPSAGASVICPGLPSRAVAHTSSTSDDTTRAHVSKPHAHVSCVPGSQSRHHGCHGGGLQNAGASSRSPAIPSRAPALSSSQSGSSSSSSKNSLCSKMESWVQPTMVEGASTSAPRRFSVQDVVKSKRLYNVRRAPQGVVDKLMQDTHCASAAVHVPLQGKTSAQVRRELRQKLANLWRRADTKRRLQSRGLMLVVQGLTNSSVWLRLFPRGMPSTGTHRPLNLASTTTCGVRGMRGIVTAVQRPTFIANATFASSTTFYVQASSRRVSTRAHSFRARLREHMSTHGWPSARVVSERLVSGRRIQRG